jgi:arginyl-tRNA synthetase
MADPLLTAADRLAPFFAAVARGGGATSNPTATTTPTRATDEQPDPAVRLSDHTHAQANGALALAKRLGRPPREVAAEIVAAANAANLDDLCTLEVAGPGFVNITFTDDFLARELLTMAADTRLGVRAVPTAQTVVVDYSGPNVAKEMHVGHLRSTVIGDALVRLFGFVGHRVIRENHIGDWGTPFGMLIEHLVDLGEMGAAAALSMGDLDGFYKQAREKFDGSELFQERARQRVVALQGGDSETKRLWTILVGESKRYFEQVYETLGVRLTPADVVGESTYNASLPDVLRRLDTAGLLTTSDGADVVFPPGFTNREGAPLPLIVQKGTGGFNYATSDLACVIDRVERLGADLVLYVVDAGQAQHLHMVFAVADMARWLAGARCEHVAFGIVLGPDRRRLKSRSGETVKLVALLAEAIERARAAVAGKNPELSADEQANIARMVGIGAVKYADLSNDRVKDYVFDWDRMLAFDGNTAPYLQYAHARIRSIFRRAADDAGSGAPGAVGPIVIAAPQERELAMALLGFDSAVWDSVDRLSPHRLCTYLFELASEFTSFYEACPVLKAASPGERSSRLALCDLTARVLAQGLDLLGIVAPERM